MNESKRRRVSDATAAVDTAATTIDAATQDSQKKPPPYLKLNGDCWIYIYDYLSLHDILQMGQTCKRMNQMSGYYIREFHPNAMFNWAQQEVRFQNFHVRYDFYPYISRMCIVGEHEMDYFSNIKTFDSLKMLKIIGCTIRTASHMENIRNILKNIETIELIDCVFVDNVFEKVANYCSKLKHMLVRHCKHVDMFKQHYPSLKKLDVPMPVLNVTRIVELKTFLEKHLQLKEFEIDVDFLWANRDVLIQANIQLDLLSVVCSTPMTLVAFDQFIDFLKTLHERGFYKTLKLEFDLIYDPSPNDNANDFEYYSNAISALPQLEKLNFWRDPFFDLNRLTNLKELYFEVVDSHMNTVNMETVAKILPKLKSVTFGLGTVHTILPFVYHSKRLKTIEIKYPSDKGIFDLFALNEVRKKLENASQISIRMPENTYLSMKWQSKQLNFEFVKIVRLDY